MPTGLQSLNYKQLLQRYPTMMTMTILRGSPSDVLVHRLRMLDTLRSTRRARVATSRDGIYPIAMKRAMKARATLPKAAVWRRPRLKRKMREFQVTQPPRLLWRLLRHLSDQRWTVELLE